MYLGANVWLMPCVTTLNDPHPPSEVSLPPRVEDRAVLSANVVLMPGVVVGSGAFIGAGALVTADVGPGLFAFGHPAAVKGPVGSLRHRLNPDLSAYPWRYPGRPSATAEDHFDE